MAHHARQKIVDSAAVGQEQTPSEPVYLYCLVPSTPENLTGKSIEEDRPLFPHRLDHHMAAILSHVALEAFTGPDAEANLQDINWVAPRAARHAEVVAQMMGKSSVLPVRFGTLYSSVEVMMHALAPHLEAIRTFLSERGHKKEYALKGFMDRQAALENITDTALAEASEKMAAMAPGARYFEEKRILRHSETLLSQWLDEAYRSIADQLPIHQNERAELKLQTRRDSGRPLEMVFNWAILLADGDRQSTTDRIAEINASWQPRGITLECTGPWPPYSFCPRLDGEAHP